MNNKILSLALAISQVFRSFLIFILIVVVAVGVILAFDTEALPFLRYDDGVFNFSGQGSSEEVGFRPDGWFILFTLIKLALTILCSILIITQILKVIQSIYSLDTFRKKNIHAFKRMASIFLILFFVHLFSLVQTEGQVAFTFAVPLQYLAAMIGCLILSEIFKEGNKLMEENHLTI